jgi:hypothetical protein
MQEVSYEVEFSRAAKWFPSLAGRGTIAISASEGRPTTVTLKGVKIWGGQTIIGVTLVTWFALLLFSFVLFWVPGALPLAGAMVAVLGQSFAYLITFGLLVAYLIALPGIVKSRATRTLSIRKLRAVSKIANGATFSAGGLLPMKVQFTTDETSATAIVKAVTASD